MQTSTKKLYLAGPMSGYADFNFPAFFKWAGILEKNGWTVFNPAQNDIDVHGEGFNDNNPDGCIIQAAEEGFSLRNALRDDTSWICIHADAIAMIPGWENSKGAKAEWSLAIALDLEIIYLS